MIKMAIVDDEEYILDAVQKYAGNQKEKVWDMVEIQTFGSAEEFLKRLDWGENYHIIFTDISLPGMSGVELGRIIKEKCSDAYLIFLTSHTEFAVQSYEIEAYQYILKQDMQKRIPAVLEKILNKIFKDGIQYRFIGTKSDVQKVHYADIIYIYKKKENKYVIYVTVKGEYEERITLKELEKELNSPEFIMAERGYIINARYVEKISGSTIYMNNGKEIAVSRARCSEVKQRLVSWWRAGR